MTIFPVFVALVLCYDNNMKSIWKLTNRMLLVAVAILLAAILVTPPVRSLLQPATHAAGIVPLTGLADPTPTPHTLHLPVIARSPIWFYTTSIYMKSINPTDAYNLGCAAGQADLVRPGIQNSLNMLFEASSISMGVTLLPCSITTTRYPFSASRSAETLPPKPLPIIAKS